MCDLQLGTLNSGELTSLPVDCEYQQAAVNFVEQLGKKNLWPAADVVRLELCEGEPAVVIRMENVWLATVAHCADYVAQLRANAAAKENDELLNANAEAGKKPHKEKS